MDAEKPAKRCENCRLPLPDLAGLRHHEPWKCTELLRAALDRAAPRKLTREQVADVIRKTVPSKDASLIYPITDEIMKLIEVEKAEGKS